MRGKGRGSPVDNIDRICKVLADGYACAKIDSEEKNCVPWEVDYVEGYNSKHPEVTCHEVNEAHSCAAYACIAEGVFIVEVVNAYFGSLGKIDMGHSHYNGFDADSNCGVVNFEREENDERARECCGNWPRRYPFRTFNNHRACCGETTYDTTMFQCCAGDDNRVQHYGIQC